MTDSRCYVERIEPGETNRLREWADELESRTDEVLETLENEAMIAESAFLHRSDEGDFLVYYLEAEDIEAAHDAAAESDFEIDREHRAVMDRVTTGATADLERLFQFTNRD